MVNPTHKALIVHLDPNENRKVMDVVVGVGPDFGIGQLVAGTRNTVRLLLLEVKTSGIVTTDQAIWNAVTKEYESLCLGDEGYSVRDWVRGYEEWACRQKTLTLDECLVWGQE